MFWCSTYAMTCLGMHPIHMVTLCRASLAAQTISVHSKAMLPVASWQSIGSLVAPTGELLRTSLPLCAAKFHLFRPCSGRGSQSPASLHAGADQESSGTGVASQLLSGHNRSPPRPAALFGQLALAVGGSGDWTEDHRQK
jgi:hypothetical protein